MTRKTDLAGAALVLLAACGSSEPAANAPVVGSSDPSRAPVTFAYDSLDDRPVTSDAMRGKPTVIAFVQTGSVWSQAQVNFLVPMAKHDEGRVNYVLVALEPRESRELVEDYKKVLGVTFPSAIADTGTMFGAGPFGALKVPTTVVLDRAGRVVFRAEARVAKSDELRSALKGL